ncbi:MAG TPA: DUF6600 domain-containing protein [Thermoanaerobaculia bacterium]
MRKTAALTFLLAVAVALPLSARGRNESYISYDDGGTIVRQAGDNREIDARVNLPVFPGDEVITNRRGRAEVRLADGNVIGIDRATALHVQSVLDSYDADSNDTIIELRYGKVAVFRTNDARESLRLDTANASYFAGEEAVFSVEDDSHGRDKLQVFDGTIEVRTPTRTARVRSGESADIDDRGLYNLASGEQDSADDFERWFLKRTDHYGNSNSRYLDRSLAYSDEDLAQHGTWTMINGYGWGWRPYVSAGWRPYFYGSWVTGPYGSMTWVSYEPWGWVPYHYGRWAFDPVNGWFWLPGASYAPAWVYWWYTPGCIGWAPAGWYDCYRPYYNWAWQPYRGGLDFGFGFFGRVRVNEVDLRPWTFLDANTIFSNRVDRAALATDVVRARLVRMPGGYGTISGMPARFSRAELRDPSGAVNNLYRRGLMGGGQAPREGATGSVIPATDLTPFFRRDAELPGMIRDRIVRTRPVDGVVGAFRGSAGGVAPIGSGSIAPIGSGSVAPIGGGSVAPTTGNVPGAPATGDGRIRRGGGSPAAPSPSDSGASRDSGGRIHRGGGEKPTPPSDGGHINRGSGDNSGSTSRDSGSRATNPSWRNHMRTTPVDPQPGDQAAPAPAPVPRNEGSNWRGRVVREPEPGADAPAPPRVERSNPSEPRGSDVPRRVIDGIGGTRIRTEGDRPSSRDSAPPPRPAESRPARDSGSQRHEGSSGGHERSASHGDGGHSSSSGDKAAKKN